MRYTFTIIFFLFSMGRSLAQTLPGKLDSLAHSAEAIASKVDSTRLSFKTRLDSLHQREDTLLGKLRTKARVASRYSQKVDSVTSLLSSKIDSLQPKVLLQSTYTKVLDSLHQFKTVKTVKRAQGKLSAVQSKVAQQLQAPQQVVNEKLNLLSGQAEGQSNLPSSVKLPGIEGKLPVTLPNASLPNTHLPSLGQAGEGNSGLHSKLGSKFNFNSEAELSQGGPIEKITGLPGKLGEASQAGNQLFTYKKELKNLQSGKLDQVSTLKKEVTQLAGQKELAELQKQQQAAQQLESRFTSLADQEEFKKQTLARAKEATAQQLAAFQARHQEAVGKVSRYQQKRGTLLAKAKGLPKQRPDPEKPVPFRERLVPGFTLQVQKPDAYWIDFNPSLRYKAKGYLSAGMGWNQRLSLAASGQFRSLSGVYGVRSFAELAVFKGFSVRLDVESMNCFVPFSRQQLDLGQRQWVWSYLLGIKKDFTFSRRVLGNVQFVYNLYDPHGWSPYLNRFNVRFGMEFPWKKQSAKESAQ